MKKVLIMAALYVAAAAAQAQEMRPAANTAPMRFVAGLGVSAGGDDLATARYTNGDSVDIKAGSGVYFTVGGDYRFTPQFSLQGTLNFHVDDTNARNGNIKFQRFPAELLAFYHFNEQWRVGAGVRYVSGAKLSSSGAASGISIDFDNTTSGVLEGEYFWSPRTSVTLRYVNEKYKAAGYREVKANHVGISGNVYF